ncbi:MAG: SIS domain-containing protein [Vulcanimicrobiota bacterium]
MLHTRGNLVFSEITRQPDIWQKTIKLYNQERETLVWIKKMKFNQIIFIGQGAFQYAAECASRLFRNLGKLFTMGLRSSDLFNTKILPFHPQLRTLVVALDNTGETPETLWALDRIKKIKADVQVIAVTCTKDSSITKKASKTILIENAADETILPIKSFSTILFFLALIGGALSGNTDFLGKVSKLPKKIDLKQFHEKITRIPKFKTAKNYFFLGAGLNRPLAAYAALMAKMSCLAPSQYMDSFEFRHNNFITVHMESITTILTTPELQDLEMEALRDSAKMKSELILISEKVDEKTAALVGNVIQMESDVSTEAQIFYIIPIVQLMAFQIAIALGRNPDKPRHLVEEVTYKSDLPKQ